MSRIKNGLLAVCLFIGAGAACAADISFIKTPYPGSHVFQESNNAYVNDFYLLLSKTVAKDRD